MLYRIYVTDRLYKDPEGMIIPATNRYADMIYKPKEAVQDERSGDEIVAEVIANAGLVVRK